MKCVSIREPWAWMILAGLKTAENRSWKTDYKGPLLIHASKNFLRDQEFWLRSQGHPLPSPFPSHHLGHIVGIVDLIGCCTVNKARERGETFAEGPWCWVLRNPRRFERPVPWRGELGMFEVELPAWAMGAIEC